MIKTRSLGTLLALGALTILPACSMMGGYGSSNQYRQSRAANAGGSAENAAQPVAPNMVKRVQAELTQQGLYQGHIDGVWGPDTRQAVTAYQRRHNLNTTGKLDVPTLEALNLAPTGTAASGMAGNGGQYSGTPNHTTGGAYNAASASPNPPDNGSYPASSRHGAGAGGPGNAGTQRNPAANTGR